MDAAIFAVIPLVVMGTLAYLRFRARGSPRPTISSSVLRGWPAHAVAAAIAVVAGLSLLRTIDQPQSPRQLIIAIAVPFTLYVLVRFGLRFSDRRRRAPGERLLPIVHWFQLLRTDRAAAATFLKAHWAMQDAVIVTSPFSLVEQLADIESATPWLQARYRTDPALPAALDALYHRRAALLSRMAALPGTRS